MFHTKILHHLYKLYSGKSDFVPCGRHCFLDYDTILFVITTLCIRYKPALALYLKYAYNIY